MAYLSTGQESKLLDQTPRMSTPGSSVGQPLVTTSTPSPGHHMVTLPRFSPETLRSANVEDDSDGNNYK